MIKFIKQISFFVMTLSFGTLLFVPGEAFAIDSGNISFNEVNRYDEIFDLYRENYAEENNMNIRDIEFNCSDLDEEIENIDLDIDRLKEKLVDETDLKKIEKYKSTKKSYNKALSAFRAQRSTCDEDGGATPPSYNTTYESKKGDYDDMRIEIDNRGSGPARVHYYLSENGDLSVNADIVITTEDIRYPYDLEGTESYSVSFKPDERTFYLEEKFDYYEDYYIYIIPDFSTTDSYFTTRPFDVKKVTKKSNNESGFADIQKTNLYFVSISKAIEKKFVEGYKDGTFRPDKSVSRKEFMKIIMKAGGIKLDSDDLSLPFNDIDDGDWVVPYLKKAVASGAVEAKNKQFYPDKEINYLEAMKLISKILKLDIGSDETKVNGLDSGHWGVTYVNYFKLKGIVPKGLEGFEKPLNRGEAIDMVIKALDLDN